MEAVVEYWLQNDIYLARLIGTEYQRYIHSSGWSTPSGMLGSE